MNYGNLFPSETLGSAGLALEDVEFSIGLAHNVSEAVKLRRATIRDQTRVHGEPEDSRDQREKQEKADDDRVFLGTIVLLAGRMKRDKRRDTRQDKHAGHNAPEPKEKAVSRGESPQR